MTLPPIEKLIEQISSGNKVQVGRNLLTKKIGEGAFAHVFEGSFDEYGRQKAAIKFPKNEDAVPNIRTRQRILSALGNCPFTPNIVDQGCYEGTIFVAEEYREKSLTDEIAETHQKTGLPNAFEITKLAKNLLKGIDYFHTLEQTNPKAAELLGVDSLVHCDIKPSNILKYIDPTGDTILQYTDFGLQSKEETTDKGLKLSFQNSVSIKSIKAKTPDDKTEVYAAPEVRQALLLEQPVPTTPQQDLWSIGAILYKYATGRVPDWGQTTTDRPELSNLNNFFEKILAGNLSKRFKTAQEALQSLENITNNGWYDSFIAGISRTGEGTYQAFKQPMKDGKPSGTMMTYNFKSTLFQPKMLYVPGINKMAIIKANTEKRDHSHGRTNYEEKGHSIELSFFDEKLNLDKCFTLTQDWKCHNSNHDPDAIHSYNARILRHNKTGQLSLDFELVRKKGEWVQKWYSESSKWADKFITVKTNYDISHPDRIPILNDVITGVFKPWKEIKPVCYAPNNKPWLEVNQGKISVNAYIENGRQVKLCELSPDYVQSAFWIPK